MDRIFAPYRIAGLEGTGQHGTGWTDELKNKVADRCIEKLAEYAPNVKNATIARRVESPAELGERLGAFNGNYYHIDMTLDQMIFFRPLPEIANYKTPIEGYISQGLEPTPVAPFQECRDAIVRGYFCDRSNRLCKLSKIWEARSSQRSDLHSECCRVQTK